MKTFRHGFRGSLAQVLDDGLCRKQCAVAASRLQPASLLTLPWGLVIGDEFFHRSDTLRRNIGAIRYHNLGQFLERDTFDNDAVPGFLLTLCKGNCFFAGRFWQQARSFFGGGFRSFRGLPLFGRGLGRRCRGRILGSFPGQESSPKTRIVFALGGIGLKELSRVYLELFGVVGFFSAFGLSLSQRHPGVESARGGSGRRPVSLSPGCRREVSTCGGACVADSWMTNAACTRLWATRTPRNMSGVTKIRS
jgi:hypothetical protein